MRSYVLAREPEPLRRELGSGAGEVARIVSEVRDRLQIDPPGFAADPKEERYRLFHAVTSFLRNAAAVQPLAIVLEDLHDVDRGTLELLLHLSRNLAGARLLVIGTYRDVEVDRSHPLSGALAELRRGAGFTRVPLRGLTVDEVHRMYEAIRGNSVPWTQAELVHRQTEGNPLFVQEVLRYLVEEGLVVREGGRYVRTDDRPDENLIPEGLRDVVGKRLSRLSERANQVLSLAAVMGRDFRLDVLQEVAGLPEEDLYQALEEASERAVVEQRQALGTVAFRFTHAFFRQTLYEEIFVPRRIRLHQQVGRALETVYGRRLEEHAAELAEHFVQSTEHEDLEKALRYCELAAQRASAVYAFGEATRHLEQALKVQEVLDADDKLKRCDLLTALAEALTPAGESARAIDPVAEEAFALAVAQGDKHRAARASLSTFDALMNLGGNGPQGWGGPLGERWATRIEESSEVGTRERVRADYVLARQAWATGDTAKAWEMSRRAVERARDLGDPAVFAQSAEWALYGQAIPPEGQAERLLLAEEVSALDAVARGEARGHFFLGLSFAYLTSGNRERADECLRLARQGLSTTGDGFSRINVLGIDALLATLAGRLEDAAGVGRPMEAIAERFGIGASGQPVSIFTRRPLLYLGRFQEALDAVPQSPNLLAAGGSWSAQRALFLAHMGKTEEATDLLGRLLNARDFGIGGDGTNFSVLCPMLEAAVLVRHVEVATVLSGRLAPISHLLHTEAYMMNCVGRLTGAAALMLGRPEEARGYYDQALEVCTRARHRPEIALTRLEIAELLLEAGAMNRAPARPRGTRAGLKPTPTGPTGNGRSAALQLLDFAIGEFRVMKMQPSLERALRHKELLKA